MIKLKNILILIVLTFSMLFSYDVEIEKQKKERELADRISSEIRKNFFDIRFLVNVEINLVIEDEENTETELLPQDLGLPGVSNLPSQISQKQAINIANINVHILVENSINAEDKNLIEQIAKNSGKLNISRGDIIDIQLMTFPQISKKQDTQLQDQLDFMERGYRRLDSLKSDQQKIVVDELRKQANEIQRLDSLRVAILSDANKAKLDYLQDRLARADSLIKNEQERRLENLESSLDKENKSVDPLVWGLIGLSVVLLLILLILLFAVLSKKKREENQMMYEYPQQMQQQIDQNQAQGALTSGGSGDQTSFENTYNEMKESAEFDKIKSNLITNFAGDSSSVSLLIKEMIADATQKDNLKIVVNQFGNVLIPVLKEYFSVDEIKIIQELSLEKNDKTIPEQKDVLEQLQTKLSLKRYAEERSAKKNPFAFLEKLSEPQLYLLMKDEQPGIIAIIISQLPSAIASSLLKGLPSASQGEVAVELGKLKRMTSDTYVSVAKKLATKAASIPVINNVQLQGSDMLLEIFDNLDESSEESIIEFIKTVNLDLYKEISSQRVGFGALHLLEDKMLRQLIKDIDNEEMAIALKNAPSEVLEKFYSILPTKQKTILEDKIAGIKKVSPDDELKARRRITRMIRTYVKSGMGSLEGLQQITQIEETIEPEIETGEITETTEETKE